MSSTATSAEPLASLPETSRNAAKVYILSGNRRCVSQISAMDMTSFITRASAWSGVCQKAGPAVLGRDRRHCAVSGHPHDLRSRQNLRCQRDRNGASTACTSGALALHQAVREAQPSKSREGVLGSAPPSETER